MFNEAFDIADDIYKTLFINALAEIKRLKGSDDFRALTTLHTSVLSWQYTYLSLHSEREQMINLCKILLGRSRGGGYNDYPKYSELIEQYLDLDNPWLFCGFLQEYFYSLPPEDSDYHRSWILGIYYDYVYDTIMANLKEMKADLPD